LKVSHLCAAAAELYGLGRTKVKCNPCRFEAQSEAKAIVDKSGRSRNGLALTTGRYHSDISFYMASPPPAARTLERAKDFRSSPSTTLAKVFEQQASKLAWATFLREKDGGTWRSFSWEETAIAAGRLRAGLKRLGIRAGDRIAILAQNCPQWVMLDQAALGLDAIVVPLYTTSGAEELRHIINDSGARLVAAFGEEAVKKVLALSASLSNVENVVAMHPGAAGREELGRVPPVRSLASLTQDPPAPVADGKSEDLATLIYTSGTTGPAKGVMLSHGNILANCEAAVNTLDLGDDDVALSVLPIAHSFERTAGYYAVMLAGASIAYAEGPGQVAQNLTEIRPTVMLVVPRLLEVMHDRIIRGVERAAVHRRALFELGQRLGDTAARYRHRGQPMPPYLAPALSAARRMVFARVRALFGGQLRYLISGGAPLPLEIFRFFAAMEVPIFEGYGLTEAAPVVSVNLPGRTKIGTVGKPLKNIEVRTLADGELLVRGPNVMKGYFGMREESARALDSDGWLHTGDLAAIDSDGYVRITGRKKEIIVLSNGKNVSPAYLESRLENDPCISQCCVVGDRQKHLAALIVPNFEALPGELKADRLIGAGERVVNDPRLRAFFHQRLREFNKAVSEVETVVAFTLLSQPFTQENGQFTPTLKLRRQIVQRDYQAEIAAMFHD
jgi:long-chain acyl-CoA synthetase